MAFSTNVVSAFLTLFQLLPFYIKHHALENRLLIKSAINLGLGTFKRCWENCIYNDVISQFMVFIFPVVLLALTYKQGLKLTLSNAVSYDKILKTKEITYCLDFIDLHRTEWKISAFIIKEYFIKIPLSSLQLKHTGKISYI